MSDLGLAWKAFWHDPVAYAKDPANAILAYQIEVKAASGESVQLIETELTEAGFEKGSSPIIDNLGDVASGVVGGVRDAFSGITGTIKNLPIYLAVILGILGVYLILMGRRGKAVI